LRLCAVAISAAVSMSIRRGLCVEKFRPRAHAPLETASSASSALVSPQILTLAAIAQS
jgi:hypothetical protein